MLAQKPTQNRQESKEAQGDFHFLEQFEALLGAIPAFDPMTRRAELRTVLEEINGISIEVVAFTRWSPRPRHGKGNVENELRFVARRVDAAGNTTFIELETVTRRLSKIQRESGKNLIASTREFVAYLLSAEGELRNAMKAAQQTVADKARNDHGQYRGALGIGEFAVLLSCASEMVYPDLLCPERYRTGTAARVWLEEITRRGGIEGVVLKKSDDGMFREPGTGRTAHEIVKERWS